MILRPVVTPGTGPLLGAIVALPLALSACANNESPYPSLSIRDQERASGVFDPVEPEPYVPPAAGPQFLSKLESIKVEAEAAHQQFLAASSRARSSIVAGRGAQPGSDAWATAQVALADVLSARSATLMPLAELDMLHADVVTEEGDTGPLETLRSAIEALLAEEDRQVAELSAQLPG